MRHFFSILVLICFFSSLQAQNDIHHYSVGEGEPILLINGGPGWSSYHMKPVAEKLSEMNNEVILYDQRGTGKSDVKIDSSSITFDQMIMDIELLRKQLEIDSWTIYGHSFGGMLAMGYASKYPEKTEKLILSAPGGVDLSFLEYYQSNLNYTLSLKEKEAIKKWSSPEIIQEDPKLANFNIIKNSISSFLYNKQLVDSIMDGIDENTANMEVSNLVFQDLIKTNYDLKPSLHKIITPTLIIQGRQDALGQVNPLTISQLIPNSQLVFLEQSAHLMWLDRPQKYYKIINEFLESADSYSIINNDKANQILTSMVGNKNMKSKILGQNGYKHINGSANFIKKLGGIEETAMITLNGKGVTARAYIKFSPIYERFELVQVDNAAGSFIHLYGYWDTESNTLKFKPIEDYSQWGSTGSLKLTWDYVFYNDGSFKKVIKLPNKAGKWIVQSEYHYLPSK